jgi:hypothetical protein
MKYFNSVTTPRTITIKGTPMASTRYKLSRIYGTYCTKVAKPELGRSRTIEIRAKSGSIGRKRFGSTAAPDLDAGLHRERRVRLHGS